MNSGLSDRRKLAAIAYEKNCKEVLCCLKSKSKKNKLKSINRIDYILNKRFK